jgi:hypothetical protein
MNSLLVSIMSDENNKTNATTMNDGTYSSTVTYETLPPVAPPMFNIAIIKGEVAKIQEHVREVKFYDLLLNNLTEYIKRTTPIYKATRSNVDTYMIPIAISNFKSVVILLHLIGYYDATLLSNDGMNIYPLLHNKSYVFYKSCHINKSYIFCLMEDPNCEGILMAHPFIHK